MTEITPGEERMATPEELEEIRRLEVEKFLAGKEPPLNDEDTAWTHPAQNPY